MAVKLNSVFECIMYEYAKLIADRALEDRVGPAPAKRKGANYWSFVAKTFTRLKAGTIKPSTVLRENKQLVEAAAHCAYCGAVTNLQWEHIIPVSRGGPDTIDNMVQACAQCNKEKGARNPIEWYFQRTLDRRNVPRSVMGKLLKVVLEEHRLRGTENATEYPFGTTLHLSNIVKVFEHSKPTSAR